MESSYGCCINCGNEVITQYCGSCGQPSASRKLNLLTLYKDFQSRIYGFDGMFPRTLRDLTIRPGEVSRAYIKGNRVKYVAPVGYFFLALTFYLLFMELLNVNLFELSMTTNPLNSATTPKQEKLQRLFTELIARYMRIFFVVLIPIIATFAWMFFRKQRFNLIEHSILAFYVQGQLIWL